MGMEDLGDLIAKIRKARDDLGGILDTRDSKSTKRFESIEVSVNELFKKLHRPGAEGFSENADERKDATEYCVVKHDIQVPKVDGSQPIYVPSPQEIDTAPVARKALKSLLRHGNLDRIDNLEKKSLTSFSLGSNQFILAPQMSNRVLSCFVDQSDIAGLMAQESTSGGDPFPFGVSIQRVLHQLRTNARLHKVDLPKRFTVQPDPDRAAVRRGR